MNGTITTKVTLIATTIFLLSGLSFAKSDEYPYTVISIHDGDTVKVQQGDKKTSVRMYGIDAPEVSPPVGINKVDWKDEFQPLADVSRDMLKTLLPQGSLVSLECSGVSYNRKVCIVRDYFYGKDINREMVLSGWAYRSNYDGKNPYTQEQLQAQKSGVGLWTQGLPQLEKPWEYRARLRNSNFKPINVDRLIQ